MSIRFVAMMIMCVVAPGLSGIQSESVSNSGRTTTAFQNGVRDYAGTIDVEIWAVAPNTCLEGSPNASSDADNDGGESQILMKFDGIFGTGPNQIPPHSAIHSATLTISAFDEGTTVHLHRMLVPWKPTATWNSVVAGVTADGLEASKSKDSFTFGKITATTSFIPFSVTDTVQAWSNGSPNHGWVFINTGGNGWDFYTSEFDDLKQRPKLVVEFTPPSRTNQKPASPKKD